MNREMYQLQKFYKCIAKIMIAKFNYNTEIIQKSSQLCFEANFIITWKPLKEFEGK